METINCKSGDRIRVDMSPREDGTVAFDVYDAEGGVACSILTLDELYEIYEHIEYLVTTGGV